MAETKQVSVIGYVRCSHAAQVEDGETLERQEQMIRDYCTRKGLPAPQVITDAGVSGFKNTARPGFQRLIQCCNARQVNVVVVYDLSRLSRSVRDTLGFIEDTIQGNGIEFVSLMNDIDTGTPMGKAFLAITAIWNQLYRDEISHKTKAALAHKRSKGEFTGGDVPFGFTVSDDGVLVADQSEIATIDLIGELRGAGLSLRGIAEVLLERGIRPKNGGQQWHAKVIADLIARAGAGPKNRYPANGGLQTRIDRLSKGKKT